MTSNFQSWYPSMNACSGATGIPKTVLRAAKDQGCQAFSAQNRVHLPTFINWYFTTSPDFSELLDSDQESAKLSKSKREAQDMENALTREEIHRLKDVERIIWQECMLPLRQELEHMPESLSQLCNPDNSKLALVELRHWLEKVKKLISVEPEEDKENGE